MALYLLMCRNLTLSRKTEQIMAKFTAQVALLIHGPMFYSASPIFGGKLVDLR